MTTPTNSTPPADQLEYPDGAQSCPTCHGKGILLGEPIYPNVCCSFCRGTGKSQNNPYPPSFYAPTPKKQAKYAGAILRNL